MKRDCQMQWWLDARFGLFIHWSPSCVAGVEIGWAKQSHPFDHPADERKKMPDIEYNQLYRQFNPADFDADFFVEKAKRAGMKYLVFTTKHHDGFANWHTGLTDYNIANTPFKRDICRELADACHRHGLKLGWYYSTRDWYHSEYLVGNNNRYNDYYHGQLRELLTNYGRVDLLWFDHTAGRWDQYRFRELFEMIYELQPHILVNNRAARFVFGPKAGTPDPEIVEITKGDFDTPEGRVGVFQYERPWESCIHMATLDVPGGWSYRPEARTKSFAECAKMLSACATGCGNLLLNIGPMPDGRIRPEELANLEAFEPWIQHYGESIYGTAGGPYINGEWGGATIRGDQLYLHIFNWKDGRVTLPALPRKVRSYRELGGQNVSCRQGAGGLFLRLEEPGHLEAHTVIRLDLEPGEPIPYIAVEGDLDAQLSQEQFEALEDPMK